MADRPGTGGPEAAREAAFRAVLCAATLLMLGLSWPLWVRPAGVEFPRVPFIGGWPEPAWLRWACCLVLAGSVAAGAFSRRALLVGLPALGALVLGDQHRFQPWAYQYGLMAVAVGATPPGRSLGFCRIVLIALYVHSGLSKLDATFPGEVGAAFLDRIAGAFGVDAGGWPGPMRTFAALAMPLGELLVGVGLIFRASRPFAVVGAALMHGTLIALLGPWGLDHSTIVVVWNGALIAEGLTLFGGLGASRAFPTWGELPGVSRAAAAVVVLAVVAPAAERRGYWDSWPSFALYASHAERVYVWVLDDDRGALPGSVREHLRPPSGPREPWRRLDLTSWSRAERGTPPYPQARAQVGVALAMADRLGPTRPVRVASWGRAGRFSGRRERREAIGPGEIRRLADGFALNALPAADRP